MRPNVMLAPAGAIALALGALSSPAHAFQFQFPFPYTLQYDHPQQLQPPGPYVTGDAKAVVLGRFDADTIADACILHGTTVQFIPSVDRRNRWYKQTGSFTAVAKLPQGQGSGAGDAVLALDNNGLSKLTWNASGVCTSTPFSGTSAWVGTQQLQVAVTPLGDIEVLALTSDTRYILRAEYDPSTGTLSSMPPVTVARACTALAAVDFHANAGLEYAIAGTWGIEVLSYTTTTVQVGYVAQTGSRSLLQRVPVASQLDRVAWVQAPTGTTDTLKVLLPSFPYGPPETGINLVGATIAQLALSDLGEDSRKELMLFADGSAYTIGVRRGTTTTFKDFVENPYIYNIDEGNTIVGRLDEYPFLPGTGVLGGIDKAPVPQVMDLDGDGDDDLFLAGHPGQGNRAMIFLGRVVDEEEFGSSQDVRAWVSYECTTQQAPNRAEIEIELPLLPTAGPAQVANHLKVTAWTQAAGAPYISTTADIAPIALGTPTSSATIVIPVSSLASGQIHLEFAFIDKNGTTVEAVFPAFHEQLDLSWFTIGQPLSFSNGTAGHHGPSGLDGGVGGTSGRPPITPPSGGGG